MNKKIFILLSGLILAGCTSPITRTPSPPNPDVRTTTESVPSQGSTSIMIANYTYSPSTLTVEPGAIVTVINNDVVAHTVTSDNGEFDTGLIPNGQGSFIAPNQPGNYPYHCTPHPYMTGVLIVE